MTTTVKVLIEGNKKCAVKVIQEDGSDSKSYPPRDVMPGSFASLGIHGGQLVSVIETGDFLN
jgi:hypothetical protein